MDTHSSLPAGVVWRTVAAARSLWPDRPGQQHLAAFEFLSHALPALSTVQITGLILTADRQP